MKYGSSIVRDVDVVPSSFIQPIAISYFIDVAYGTRRIHYFIRNFWAVNGRDLSDVEIKDHNNYRSCFQVHD